MQFYEDIVKPVGGNRAPLTQGELQLAAANWTVISTISSGTERLIWPTYAVPTAQPLHI